jgi:exodeoxyribonuclease-3
MRIISWNTNGIQSTIKQDLFEPLFAQYKPDIVCFQETKVEAEQLPEEIKNFGVYKSFYAHSKKRRGYSGVAIYTTEMPISVLYDIPSSLAKKYKLEDDSHGDPNHEGRVIALEMKKFYIVNVYTPNAKPDLSRLQLRHKKWDPAFLEYCKQLEKKKPVIFCGDLNVAHTEDDLANPKANVGEHGFTDEEREGIDVIIKKGFVDTFRLFTKGSGYYTWWSNFGNARARNTGWRIDYFFVSKVLEKKVKKVTHLTDYMGSDHCPMVLDIDL